MSEQEVAKYFTGCFDELRPFITSWDNGSAEARLQGLARSNNLQIASAAQGARELGGAVLTNANHIWWQLSNIPWQSLSVVRLSELLEEWKVARAAYERCIEGLERQQAQESVRRHFRTAQSTSRVLQLPASCMLKTFTLSSQTR